MDYSIVIPTFNERENIVTLAAMLAEVMKGIPGDYEIIVVDDNSPDRTWEVVEELGKADPRIKVIRRMKDPGLSPSIVEGFDKASGRFLAAMDADLQHDETRLPAMFEAAREGADIVAGTRYAHGGSIEGGWPAHRRLMSWTATMMARVILGVSISDPMSGFFIVSSDAYKRIRPQLDPKGFKIFLEILYLLKRKDGSPRIREVGICFRKRRAGESKLGLKVIFNYLLSLIQLKFKPQPPG